MRETLRSLAPIVLVAGALLVAGTAGTPSQPVGEGVVIESPTTELDADDGTLRLAPDTGLNPGATATVELVVRNTGEHAVVTRFNGDRIDAVGGSGADDRPTVELAPGAEKPVSLTVDTGTDDVTLSIDVAVRDDDERADESTTPAESATGPEDAVGDPQPTPESPDQTTDTADRILAPSDGSAAADPTNDDPPTAERSVIEQTEPPGESDQSNDDPSDGSGSPTSAVVAPLLVVGVLLVLVRKLISSETSP